MLSDLAINRLSETTETIYCPRLKPGVSTQLQVSDLSLPQSDSCVIIETLKNPTS